MQTLDTFTRAYIQTALWSSHGGKYAECPCCGRMAVLDHLPEPEFDQKPMCAAETCGVREMNEPPLDENYSAADLAPETLEKFISDCARFQSENSEIISAAIATGEVRCGPDFDEWGRAGHDFWLTRCGHGAGFWDGDWPRDAGEALTQASKAFGNVDLYVGDDGKIYCA